VSAAGGAGSVLVYVALDPSLTVVWLLDGE
jgi:hypothetical protein